MEYTIWKLGNMAGVSTRTLRYYDELGLLKPARINSSGYRIYGQTEVDRLQQILFYRELGMGLEEIGKIMTDPAFDGLKALKDHKIKLLEKKKQLDSLIANVEKTIASSGRKTKMEDNEKFEGFKKKLIDENEKKYGKEVHDKYGKDQVEKSNKKFGDLTKEQYAAVEKLTKEVNEAIKAAFSAGDPAGPLAQKACDLHRQYLMYFWETYSKQAHMGLVQMYVDDSRFTAYYDKIAPGSAVFLRDAMKIYIKE